MSQAEQSASKKKGILQPYVWICLAVIALIQVIVYFGTRLLLPYLPSYKLNLPLDAAIPFIPEWVIVYDLAFVSWAVSGVLVFIQGKAHTVRFAISYTTALILSMVIFLAWPLTIDRPEIVGGGLARDMLRHIYEADEPNNLFPSLHVLASYFSWRELWGCPRIPRWYKAFNLIFLLLVCLSVVFVKQHLSIDILGGIVVGEASLQIGRAIYNAYVEKENEKNLRPEEG